MAARPLLPIAPGKALSVDFALWSVAGTAAPRRLTRSAPDSETNLETWIEQRPELIRDGLLVVARQVIFPTRERLDLLCIENQSRWVIVELKRDRMAREVVAQALDYVSLLQQMSASDLRERLTPHLEKLPVPDRELALNLLESETDDSDREVAVILAGVTADAALLRITEMLNRSYSVPISVIELRAFETPGGDLLLAREETGNSDTSSESTPHKRPSQEQGVPESDRWTRVMQEADKYGMADALRSVRTAIEDAGLYARPYTRSVMITPPQQRGRYLAVIGFHGAGGSVMWGADAVREFYPEVRLRHAERLLGATDVERAVDAAELEKFGQAWKTLMATSTRA